MSKTLILLVVIGLCSIVYSNQKQLKTLYQQVMQENLLTSKEMVIEKKPLPVIKPQSKVMYQWTDKNGRTHFSEQPPNNPKFKIKTIQIKTVQTTAFKKTPKIKTINNQRRNNNDHSSKSNSRCKKLKKDIKKREHQLKSRGASAFDSGYKKLREKRWQSLKNCY